jgi:hypothetical protein
LSRATVAKEKAPGMTGYDYWKTASPLDATAAIATQREAERKECDCYAAKRFIEQTLSAARSGNDAVFDAYVTEFIEDAEICVELSLTLSADAAPRQLGEMLMTLGRRLLSTMPTAARADGASEK